MSWINKISSSPVILLVCSYALFVEEVIYGMVAPLTPESPAQIKDEHTISMLYGTYAFGLILATPILGIITDRIGRRQPMVIGAICLLVSSICFSQVGYLKALVPLVAGPLGWLLLRSSI